MKPRHWLPAALAAAGLTFGAAHGLRAQQPPPRSPSVAKGSRVFELRTYHAAPGKLEALHARFRDHTNQLFRKHGMTMVGYWVPVKQEDTLVYMLAFPSAEAREKAWAGFAKDPEWQAARQASEVNGKLVEKVESLMLQATDYSPIR